jgi:signal peptidase I
MGKLFRSKTARMAVDMSKHVRKILSAQRDILSPQAVASVEKALAETELAVSSGATENDTQDCVNNLESVANKWLKPYPNAGIRENVEVLLVALTVAMAIRTFVLQPFKIPTGSMQPTLFGVTTENLKLKPAVKIPGLLRRLYDGAVLGIFYHYQEAEMDCQVESISPVNHVLFFISNQSITVRYGPKAADTKSYTFWMVPDDGRGPGDIRFGDPDHAGIAPGEIFRKGQPIVNFLDRAGDHLFVDRVSYNFRHPTRGEIMVFETEGVGNSFAHLPPGQFYIKRMVAMGGENVSIGNDRHLVINGKRLDKDTPHFENVYSFDPGKLPHESQYSGHLNQFVFDQSKIRNYQVAPLFPDEAAQYQVQPDHYMVMGDNTCNSFDSRAWGDFTRTNVIGKYFFVYWPITKRFGWNLR